MRALVIESEVPLRRFDHILRSAAYDVLCTRDGTAGWKPHRAKQLASTDSTVGRLTENAEIALCRMVTHAYKSVPFYRAAWDAIGFRPTPEFGKLNLPHLPFLTKDTLRKHKLSLLSSDFRVEDLVESVTGGTTGTQTSFYMDNACRVARLGRQWGILELCGYSPGMRRGLVWGVHGELLESAGQFSPKRWFRHYASSDESLGCAVLNEQLMAEYHARLRRFRPEILYGYPSALCQLALFIRHQRLEPVRARTVITTAERLTTVQRDNLSSAFCAEVFNLYCTREHGCIGFECREHDGLHIDTESVIVEIVRDGRCVAPGESGEITITDLQNRGMPFIRSRTGDIGALSGQQCRCGLPQPILMSLDGRSTDAVYRADGSIVAGLMLTDLFVDVPSIRFAQFLQDSPRTLDVVLVTTAEYSPEVERDVIRQVKVIMGEGTAINVQRVADIQRNPSSGKFQEVICRIRIPTAPEKFGNRTVRP